MDENEALAKAVEAASWSKCLKSQRGVVIWRRSGGVLSQGFNFPVTTACDGSDACKADCAKRCIHAEQHALMEAQRYGKGVHGAEMLHVKTVNGAPVPSGEPSCWQCSRVIATSDLAAMWLLVLNADGDPVLRRYTTREFHELTLTNCGIHPHRPTPLQKGDCVRVLEEAWDRFLDICAEHPSVILPPALKASESPFMEINEIDLDGKLALKGLPLSWWWEPTDVER